MGKNSSLSVFTVGHSNQSISDFIDLLELHSIELLVDVRSVPYSRYVPHFSKNALEMSLDWRGINYIFMGSNLGGKPKKSNLSNNSSTDYSQIRLKSRFKQGIEELVDLAENNNLTIMCAEEDPSNCHRNKLIVPALQEFDITIKHIRKYGLEYGNSKLDQFF